MKNLYLISLVVILHSGIEINAQIVADEKDRPNIIFFIGDDMDHDLFNYIPEGRGKNLTPNIDRLAKEGTIIRNQLITSPICTPSRYSCMTGLYPSASENCRESEISKATGMSFVTYNTLLRKNEENLAKTLQSAGYYTGLSGKCHFVSGGFQGWKRLDNDSDPNDPIVKEALRSNYQLQVEAVKEAGFDEVNSLYFGGDVRGQIEALRVHNMDWIAKGALDFLDSAETKQKPFFLYVAPTLTHEPHAGSRSWNADARITPAGILDEPCMVLPERDCIPSRLAAAGIPLETRRLMLGDGICQLCAHGVLCEDRRAMMVAVDDALGAIIKKLEEMNQLDHTVIFFFNDQGQAGKSTIYETGVKCASIVWRDGGFPVGNETGALVSNIDFAPTIADLSGTELPYKADGVSIMALLEGKTDAVRESAYFELGFSRGVRKGQWKYIALRYPDNAVELGLCYESPEGIRSYSGFLGSLSQSPRERSYDMFKRVEREYPHFYDQDQLYNLENDPDEQENLASDPEYEEVLYEMKQELKNYISTVPGSFGWFRGS